MTVKIITSVTVFSAVQLGMSCATMFAIFTVSGFGQ